MEILFIAIGGAVGSVLRFFTVESVLKIIKSSGYAIFPFQTLSVNVVGSLLAGIFYYIMIKNFDNFDPRLKQIFLYGFLGAFTTFSAFSLDILRLFNSGQYNIAILYAFASVILSILAVFFGFYLMKIIF